MQWGKDIRKPYPWLSVSCTWGCWAISADYVHYRTFDSDIWTSTPECEWSFSPRSSTCTRKLGMGSRVVQKWYTLILLTSYMTVQVYFVMCLASRSIQPSSLKKDHQRYPHCWIEITWDPASSELSSVLLLATAVDKDTLPTDTATLARSPTDA